MVCWPGILFILNIMQKKKTKTKKTKRNKVPWKVGLGFSIITTLIPIDKILTNAEKRGNKQTTTDGKITTNHETNNKMQQKKLKTN